MPVLLDKPSEGKEIQKQKPSGIGTPSSQTKRTWNVLNALK